MHKTDTPAKVASNAGLGPLPPTNYVIGLPGDGYSDDRLLDEFAWDEDAVRAYAAAAVATERERCAKLQRVWEDTRTQRDDLLAHLTRKAPLPAWAVEWIRVYGA